MIVGERIKDEFRDLKVLLGDVKVLDNHNKPVEPEGPKELICQYWECLATDFMPHV